MNADFRRFEPYFRNGLLYFPKHTIEALLTVGLDKGTSEKALRGLALDDVQSLTQLSQAIQAFVGQVERETAIAGALTSEESHFALTGLPVHA